MVLMRVWRLEKNNYLKDFYGDDRHKGSVKKNKVDDEYLLLYYIGKDGHGKKYLELKCWVPRKHFIWKRNIIILRNM